MDPRELKAAANRIIARRNAIANMRKVGLKVLSRDQRGLFRLLIRNLDQINLSLLALIGDEKGYKACVNSAGGSQAGDRELAGRHRYDDRRDQEVPVHGRQGIRPVHHAGASRPASGSLIT